jgi:hypothetical protein
VKVEPAKCLCSDCVTRDPSRAKLARRGWGGTIRKQRKCPECGRWFERQDGRCTCGGAVALEAVS